MRKITAIFFLSVVTGAALVPVSGAAAGGRPYPRGDYLVGQQWPEARGCYYFRGREFCGKYCYIEVNGQRYCQERLRHAFPQAGAERLATPSPRPYRYGVRGGWWLK